MMFSFSAYIAAFAILGFSTHLWQFVIAMTFYALGQAFRTGTHKAMIFDYLAREGRTDEKTHYYGTTRSWSKMGSVLSAIIGPALVILAIVAGRSGLKVYQSLFLVCIVPYLLGLVNFALYPKYLEGTTGQKPSVGKLSSHLLDGLRAALRAGSLRRLVIESMGYEGLYKAMKDYVQPLAKVAALMIGASLPILAGLHEKQQVAIMIGLVYLPLFFLESIASRRSEAVRVALGGEEPGARFLWKLNLLIFALIAGGLLLDWRLAGAGGSLGLVVAITGFMALAVLQNLWRPMHIGRFDTHGKAQSGATLLSIESQAKSLSAAIFAPLLGLAVDAMRRGLYAGRDEAACSAARFLPAALAGLAFAAAVLIVFRRPIPVPAGDTGGGDDNGV